MSRRGPVLALGALLLALPSGGQAGQERTPCQKLSAKHDLAPAKRVKLVEQDHGDITVLKGCVLPAGRLFTVASRSANGDSTNDFELRQVTGHQVVLNIDFATLASKLHATDVFDLKRGRRYSIASRCTQTEPGQCGEAPDETALRVRVNSSGQAAAILSTKTSDIVTVVGYSPRGNRKVLDSGTRDEIPVSSLEVEGHVASWTHGGAGMSARLPNVTECQKLNAKPPKDLAGARKVKLVERENTDGGKDLVGCVLPDGKVSVVASSAKKAALDRGYKILQVAGHEVLVRGEATNQYGRGVSTYVYDLRRAKSYNLAESCFNEHGAACAQTYAKRAFANAQGQSAAIVRTDGSDQLQVIGFKSTGASKVLDSGTRAQIPASSLSLEGHVVRWTHSGAPRSATLSG
jgi:hypothetical protein